MTSRRTVVLGVAAWLLVVVAGASLVWAVISRAGEGVASNAQPDLSTSTVSEQRAPRPDPTKGPTRSGSPTNAGQPEQPTAERRIWQGAPGHVIAECDGTAIASRGAHPNPGWRIEVDSAGPAELEVEFESADERSRVRLEAVCRAGVPVFEVDVRDKG